MTHKIIQVSYGKTWKLIQRLSFDHKKKQIIVSGMWIKKSKGNPVKYKVINSGSEDEYYTVGPIPEIPTFKGTVSYSGV